MTENGNTTLIYSPIGHRTVGDRIQRQTRKVGGQVNRRLIVVSGSVEVSLRLPRAAPGLHEGNVPRAASTSVSPRAASASVSFRMPPQPLSRLQKNLRRKLQGGIPADEEGLRRDNREP